MRRAARAIVVGLALAAAGCPEPAPLAGPDAPPPPGPVAAPEPPPPPHTGALFEDMAPAAGLGGVTAQRGSFADLDGDGRPDLVLEGPRIFLARGGRFEERARPFSPTAPAKPHSTQVGDVDGDGRADLFLGRMDGPNELWRGD